MRKLAELDLTVLGSYEFLVWLGSGFIPIFPQVSNLNEC